MSELLAFMLTPTGVALYVGFWIFKILLGAWLVRCALALLPDRARLWIEARWARINLGRFTRPFG